MRKIDRLDIYMKFKGLNDNRVTKDIELSIGTIGKSRQEGRDLSNKVIDSICERYSDINKVWLLTGEGEMLKSGMSISGNGNTQVQGNNNNVDSSALVSKALDEVSEIRKLLQEQIELCSTQAKTIARLTELLGK